MKKTLLIAVALACVTLLASVAEAVPQKSSAAAHKRRASHQKSQPQSIALDRPPLDESAVKWSCEHNKAFWLSGEFKTVEMAAADAQPKPMPLLFSADSEEPDSAAAAHAPFSASKTPSATRQ